MNNELPELKRVKVESDNGDSNNILYNYTVTISLQIIMELFV